MSVTFQVKRAILVIIAIDMLWIKFVNHKIWQRSGTQHLYFLSQLSALAWHTQFLMVVCVGASWHWLHWTKGKLRAASQRSHLFCLLVKKPCQVNEIQLWRGTGYPECISKRELLYEFFWSKLQLAPYNCFWPCCISDTQWFSSVLLYPFIFDCHCRAFVFMKITAITYLKAIILTTIFSYSVAFIQCFRFADKVCSADIWPYYVIILCWCLKNFFSCSRCALSTYGASNFLL